MNDNSLATQLNNMLLTKDLSPEMTDAKGKHVLSPDDAELFNFDFKVGDRNYGTVVILLGADNNLEVYYGDNLGRGMEEEDREAWYDFLFQIRMLAKANLMKYDLQDISRLKYTMQGMAAIKEGLFEGYYGTKKISYSDQPKKTKLVIKHNKTLGENDARFRYIESLFVETEDGNRFRLPFTKLVGGRAMARHCAEGGTPYDAFGKHICEMIAEMNTLSRFVRASKHKQFEGEAGALVESAIRHYNDLKAKAKRMISQRGYREELEKFNPTQISDSEVTAEAIRDMFVEQSLDSRIEEALPLLAQLAAEESKMKEVDQFECWANQVMEGTWALPETPEQQKRLQELLAKELPVGPDAVNATEQLYDIIGDDQLFDRLMDLADSDPDADARPVILDRLKELGITVDSNTEPAPEISNESESPEPISAMSNKDLAAYINSTEEQVAQDREAAEQAAEEKSQDYAQDNLAEAAVKFEPVEFRGAPREGDIHTIGRFREHSMLPGFYDNSTPEDYSDSYYFKDPVTDGMFVVYAHGHSVRIRGVNGMPESRVIEIAKTLTGGRYEPTMEDRSLSVVDVGESKDIDNIIRLARG